jgi:hypothetical protein
MEACGSMQMSNMRTELLMMRSIRSDLPFWGMCNGKKDKKTMPLDAKRVAVALLMNSLPLSAWKHLMGRPN